MFWSVRRRIADRVYYGWIIAIACLIATMTVFGTTYTFSVFFEVFLDEFSASRSLIAFVYGLQTAVLYIAGVPAGEAIDRYGRRWIIMVSGVVFAGGLLWASAADSYVELLLAFGVVTAVGMAGLYVVGYATIPAWFKHRRGAAAGLASSGLGIGLVVFPPATEYLISSIGWRSGLVVLAMFVIGLTMLVWVLFVDRPSDVGASLDREFPSGESGVSTSGGTGESILARVIRIASLRTFQLVFIGWILVFAPLYALMSHIVLFAEHIGLGGSVGVLGITIIGAVTIVSRLTIGSLSDRLGRTRVFIGSAIIIGTTVAALTAASSFWVFVGVIFIYGIGYGGAGGLIGPQVADFFGDTDLNMSFAMLSIAFSISGMAAAPLAGYGFEVFGGYTVPFIGLGIIGIIGAGFIAYASRTQ